MWNIKLTSKNQATFPKSALAELGVQAGDRLRLVREVRGGRVEWRLVPPGPDWAWVGAGRGYARGKSNRIEDIRKSIGRALGSRKGR